MFSTPFGFQGQYARDPFSTSHGRGVRQRQELARRQRMVEEERRRRADIERRRRIAAEYELRQRQELQRQRTMEEERRRRADNERGRRLAAKAEASRRRQAAMSHVALGEANRRGRPTVVLGPDGNLYRIAEPARFPSDDKMEPRFGDGDFDESSFSSEESTRIEGGEETCSTSGSDDDESTSADSDISSARRGCGDSDGGAGSASAATARVPIGEIVVVENASDDEDDELREMRSVWRNRVPSPGQWMEPVESLRGRHERS